MTFFQDLLLGESCCIDVTGVAMNSTSGEWTKRCCSNPRGAFVHPSNDLNQDQIRKIDVQIGRMDSLQPVI